ELREELEGAVVGDYAHTNAGGVTSPPGRLSRGAIFLGLAIVVGGATALVGKHLHAKRAAAASSAAVAVPAPPTPAAAPEEKPSSEIAEAAPERPKHNTRPAHHGSKRHASRKHDR